MIYWIIGGVVLLIILLIICPGLFGVIVEVIGDVLEGIFGNND